MEHIYTIQQISGGPSYNSNTLVGNWSEDRKLAEARKRDFLEAKDSGNLLVHEMKAKMRQHLQPIQLRTLGDGKLRFDDVIQLQCLKTEGVLSTDLSDQITNTFDLKFVLTTCLYTPPAARSCFKIVRVPKDGYDPHDDLVHYDQFFRLQLCPDLGAGQPLFVHSLPKTPTNVSKITREQEVTVCNKGDQYTTWRFHVLDPNLRPETDGTPVLLEDCVMIKHTYTNTALAGSDAVYRNDFIHFTTDHEVHCKDYLPHLRSRDHLPIGTENQWKIIGRNPE